MSFSTDYKDISFCTFPNKVNYVNVLFYCATHPKNKEVTFVPIIDYKPKKIQMKKITLLFLAIGLITMAATTKNTFTSGTVNKNSSFNFMDAKYKACIDACNACVASCKNCESMCTKGKDAKMTRCIQLCKECVVACTASSQLMSMNSESAKEMCAICANICDKCATECEKMTSDHCKTCATDCRKAAKMCREM